MVDFQSRDTRRRSDDDSDEEEETEETAAGEAATEQTEPTADQSGGDEVDENGAGTGDIEAEEYLDTFSYAVVTVAADRTIEEDTVGNTVVDAVEGTGDAVATRELLAPEYDGVQQSLGTLVDRRDVDAIVTLGGEGVRPEDVVVDAASDLFDKELPGFGELFRVYSHDHEGTAVVRTRATAGIIDDIPVFCLPDDSVAARRGIEQIVAAEAPEIASLAATDDEA